MKQDNVKRKRKRDKESQHRMVRELTDNIYNNKKKDKERSKNESQRKKNKRNKREMA